MIPVFLEMIRQVCRGGIHEIFSVMDILAAVFLMHILGVRHQVDYFFSKASFLKQSMRSFDCHLITLITPQ